MPGKKKKYNARFPPARIKKIMQSDDEVGKVAAPVPVIISRALEMFAETLLQRARKVTSQRGARTLTPSHLKFCIQSEARFDFLKEMVGSVPELQGDMDVEGGLGVMGERPSDGRLGGVGRARGVGRATVPGTGKRRGRPPKVAGAPPSARTKRSVEKFVDEEYDCSDIVEIDSDQWPSAKKFCNGTTSNPGQSPAPSQSPQERLFHPQPDASHRLNSFSSPFNIQRSVTQNDFSGSKIVPTRSTSSSASSSSLCQPSVQLETSKDKTDSPSPLSGEISSYQRTNSLPPPAPVYTGTYSRLFRSTSTTGGSLQGPLHGSLTSSRNGGAGPAFKVQTNGNLTLTGLQRAPPGQTNPPGAGQELDEDYDC